MIRLTKITYKTQKDNFVSVMNEKVTFTTCLRSKFFSRYGTNLNSDGTNFRFKGQYFFFQCNLSVDRPDPTSYTFHIIFILS